MGIIAFAGLLICLAGAVLLYLICGWVVNRKFSAQSARRRSVIHNLSVFVLVLTAWLAFNYSDIVKQHQIDAFTQDCGWKVYKQAVDVEGVYLEDDNTDRYGDINKLYLGIYPQIEYQDKGKKFHIKKLGSAEESTLDKRTFRYGFRREHQELPHQLTRYAITYLDFDTQEKLAEDIFYEINDTSNPDIQSLMFFFVSYHPHSCGWAGSLERERRYKSVLRPKPVEKSELAEHASRL